MKVAVIQSNYLPWKGYFDIIHDADIFCFYDEVKYTKNDWRNRNKIYCKNGLQWITIPIYKDAVKQKISEVLLNDHTWQESHYDILHRSLKDAKYYNQLEYLLPELYKKNKWDYLSSFNQYSIKKIADYLGITTQFVNSRDYDVEGGKIERLINLLVKLKTTEYITGPKALNYLHGYEDLFKQNNIRITYKNYEGYPSYPQLNSPFENSVSIADLIANVHVDEIPYHIWGWRTK